METKGGLISTDGSFHSSLRSTGLDDDMAELFIKHRNVEASRFQGTGINEEY